MNRNGLVNSVTPEHYSAITAWWQAFTEAEARMDSLFSGLDRSFDLVAFMDTYLGAVSPEICWEFGPPVAGKQHRLVLTPEAHRQLRPLVRAILADAPSTSQFEFYEYRLPEPLDWAEATMNGRTGWKDIASIDYTITPGRFNTFDLCYYLPWDGDEHDLLRKALVLTETLLGEERLDKWVGIISTKRKAAPDLLSKIGRDADEQGKSVASLREDFEARIATAQTAFVPFRQLVESKSAKWALFRFEPKVNADYAAKADIYVAPFINNVDLMQATMQENFYSERFSRDETFIYLKTDGTTDDLNQEIFGDRGSIDDALNAALSQAGLGCTIGGGTGLRYSYVDMAITDLDTAIPLIRQTLQEGKMTKRSWILFQDADLQSEWIGIWDDSPMPPMPLLAA